MGKYTVTGGSVSISILLGDNERWVVGFGYKGAVQPMYPTWDGANKPAYGSDNSRIISSKVYVYESTRYDVGIDGNLETIKLPNYTDRTDRYVSNYQDYITQLHTQESEVLSTVDSEPINVLVAYNTTTQTSFTGFDREKPLRGAYFGVDKIIDIEQSEPYPLTIVSLVTKTDLN
jgi:hypothetical protein